MATAKKPAATSKKKAPAKKPLPALPNGGTVDAYLASCPPDQRKALKALRQTIRSVAPEAEERISYGICCFYDWRLLVGYGANRSSCSFYLCSGSTLGAFKKDIAGFEGTKSALHFTPKKPLPVALVKKLVKARIVENRKRLEAEED